MGAVTYPKAEVKRFIEEELVPLRLPTEGDRADSFHLRWTPTILILDPQGHEHHRLVGFLEPDEFLATLKLMKAKTLFARARFAEALDWFERLLKDNPGTFAAPEAVYLGAVCRYRLEKDASILKKAQERMVRDYPSSEWAQRMKPYSLL